MIPTIDTYIDWRCPQCGKTARTQNDPPRSARMHQCPKLRGLTTPMVRLGQDAEVVIHEREDYVGKVAVQRDPETNRPVMNIETRYADGRNDLIVLAPVATLSSIK